MFPEFPSRLKKIRCSKGLDQLELGQRSGIPNETISRLENAWRVPSLSTVCKLANALDVSAHALLGECATEQNIERMEA